MASIWVKKTRDEPYNLTSIINITLGADEEEKYENEDIVDIDETFLKRISARNSKILNYRLVILLRNILKTAIKK